MFYFLIIKLAMASDILKLQFYKTLLERVCHADKLLAVR